MVRAGFGSKWIMYLGNIMEFTFLVGHYYCHQWVFKRSCARPTQSFRDCMHGCLFDILFGILEHSIHFGFQRTISIDSFGVTTIDDHFCHSLNWWSCRLCWDSPPPFNFITHSQNHGRALGGPLSIYRPPSYCYSSCDPMIPQINTTTTNRHRSTNTT